MKISNVKNPKRFFETLSKCEGRIELVTDDGDRLNLKSKLCQYISMVDIFNNPAIGEIEIVCSNPLDYSIIIEYLIRG